MRVFESLDDAVNEIQRDVYKGAPTLSTRVQQFTDIELSGKERVGYEYGILGSFPESPAQLVELGLKYKFPIFVDNPTAMTEWLYYEGNFERIEPYAWLGEPANEARHPALANTFEGKWPSYTYRERLAGAVQVLAQTLAKDRDSRRAYWPIYRPEDSLRAMSPTRVPCSLGYHAMIRNISGDQKLILTYLSRSVDFDTFWLSDIWLARQFQLAICAELGTEPGMVIHNIISFHSFDNREEIY